MSFRHEEQAGDFCHWSRTLWVGMIFIVSFLGYEFVHFARHQEHVSALKGISLAISEYHDAHKILPVEEPDDLLKGGWRKRLYDSQFSRGAYGSAEGWRQVLEKYALLVPSDSPWLDGKTQSILEMRDRSGNPVVVVQLPKPFQGRGCSVLVLNSNRQRLRFNDGPEDFPLTVLRDMNSLRRDGSTRFIPPNADEAVILKILGGDD